MQLSVPPPRQLTINGMPAAITTARVATQGGVIDASVVAYQWDAERIYHFVMLTRGGSGLGPFASMVNSLRQITPAEAAAIRPRVIRRRDGQARRHGAIARRAHGLSRFQLERFLSLNGLTPTARWRPGRRSSWSSSEPERRG